MMRLAVWLPFLITAALGCGDSDVLRIHPFQSGKSLRSGVSSVGIGKQIVIQAHTGCIDAISFSSAGDELATCGLDGAIRVWDTRNGDCVRSAQNKSRVVAIDYSSKGDMLVSGTADGGIHLWESGVSLPIAVARAATPPQSLALSPDGSLLAVGTSPLQLFRVSDWMEIRQTPGHEAYGDTLVFAPSGDYVVSDNPDGFAKVWEVPSLHERFSWQHDAWVTSVDVSRDSNWIVTASCKRETDSQTMQLSIYDARSGKPARRIDGPTLRGHLHNDVAVRFTPNGRLLIASLRGAHDTGEVREDVIQTEDAGGLYIWDALSGKLLGQNDSNKDAYRITVSEDSERFAFADVDGIVEIWRIADFLKLYPAN
jgi:WD40 repeat protein